jgi:hypothetical protein
MRFTKSEILESFSRQDRSYRLAILCTHWLQDTARYKPSASEDARGLQMQTGKGWISYADLAHLLEQQQARSAITSDFVLDQLHSLIRAPFELLTDYCEDYDREVPTRHLVKQLKEMAWYEFARLIRNAVSHNFRFEFKDSEKRRMPIKWNQVTLTEDLHGKAMTYESFWHKPGYELFLEMREFAEALPEMPMTKTLNDQAT